MRKWTPCPVGEIHKLFLLFGSWPEFPLHIIVHIIMHKLSSYICKKSPQRNRSEMLVYRLDIHFLCVCSFVYVCVRVLVFFCVFGCGCVQVHLCHHRLRHRSAERLLLETTGGSRHPGHYRRRWETHLRGVLIHQIKVHDTFHEDERLHCFLPAFRFHAHSFTHTYTNLCCLVCWQHKEKAVKYK